MTAVDNVAAYVLRRSGKISPWKMQKLIYWCQAWHLAWEEEPLFRARIEAWANGPVVPLLYAHHRETFSVTRWPWGDARKLNKAQRETVDIVVKDYGRHESFLLSELVKNESPWREAREGLPQFERGRSVIGIEEMHEYYSALDASDAMITVADLVWP